MTTAMRLEWVATAVFLILAVIALRAVFGRRVSARLRYALWAAVLLRLLIPVQLFTSPLAGTVMTFTERTEQNVYTAPSSPGAAPSSGGEWTAPFLGAYPVDTPLSTEPVLDHQSPGTAPSETYSFLEPPPAPNAPDAPNAPEAPGPDWSGWVWLDRIWLAGSVVMALVLAASNLRFYRRLRRSRAALEGAECPLPVYVAVGLPSPCLFGLVRPAIYVTPEAAADPAVLRHVLAHEHTHFRHGDHIWNLLRCAALCLHWWNPLVWLSAVLSRRDGELACDEGALRRLGDGERTAYGNTLLALSTAPVDPGSLLRCTTAMAGDKKSLKERISRIAHAPKKWLWAAAAAALCLALACVCAFGQKAEEPEPANMPDLDAELTFSLKFSDDGAPYVRMDGTVGNVTLPRGAFWDPEPGWGESSAGELSMVYMAFTDSIEGHVSAWWADEDRTSVTLSTRMTAMLSSSFSAGYWDFTVDLNNGAVTAMDSVPFREGFPDDETRFYPKSISDEEAVLAARVAAKLLTAGEDYYNSGAEPSESSTGDPLEGLNELLAHFTADTSGVPDDVLYAMENWVREEYESVPFSSPFKGLVSFDDWRVEALAGPWTDTVKGRNLELWRINYEFHTNEPEKARQTLAGARYLTEDNWFCPTCPNSTFLIFVLDKEGERRFSSDMADNLYGPLMESYSGTEAYSYVKDTIFSRASHIVSSMELLTGAQVMPPAEDTDYNPLRNTLGGVRQPDLNGNGVREELWLGDYRRGGDPDGDIIFGLGVWEDGELLWNSAEADFPGAENDYLLVDLNGGDAMLRLRAYGKGGYAYYSFTLFDLVGGVEYVLRQKDVSFNYASAYSSAGGVAENFDPEAIADFLYEVNNTLSRSAVLLDPLGLFVSQEERDAPHLDLRWLEFYAPGFRWDDGQSDLENLTRFKAAALAPQPESAPADATTARQAREDLRAALLGEQSFTFYSENARMLTREMDINSARHAFFDSEYASLYVFAVLDLDGDGTEEAVVQITDVAGDMGGYLVFHWTGPGDVRCYPSYWRNFWELKTDGTFLYDYYMGNAGYARVSFPAPGYSLAFDRFIEEKYVPGGEVYDVTYTIDGQPATYEEGSAAVERQRAKEDAAWYEFTPENVAAALG